MEGENSKSNTGRVLRILTLSQNLSALVFSGFLGVHLISPLAASIGGIQWADRTLLLGREYYLPSETITIYLPLSIHLTSSIAKRVCLTLKTRKVPRTTHVITGWILPWFLIPHILSHRLIPRSPLPPISGLSPSELGYEFVGYTLNQGFLSWIGYLGLIAFGTVHAGIGMMKVVSWLKRRRSLDSSPPTPSLAPRSEEGVNSTPANLEQSIQELQEQDAPTPSRKISKRRKFSFKGIMLVYLGIISIGLWRVAKESRYVSRLMASRYDAVHARLWAW